METGISKRVLIIIPCYNEEENVSALHASLSSLILPGYELVPLFINDASKDKTLQVLRKLNAKFLDNPINLGIGGTVQLGFMYAYAQGFDLAVQMDGDGQHPPSELHKLLTLFVTDETDVAIGSRFVEGHGFQSTFTRRMGIRFFYQLNRFLTGIRVQDSTSGYRAYNRKALKELLDYYPDEYPEPEAITYLAAKKIRIREIAVTMNERTAGTSSIRRFHTIYYMAKVSFNILFLHLKMKFK